MLTNLPLSAEAFRAHIKAVDAARGWPTYVITNHDIRRSYSRYGDGVHNDDVAKMMAGLYLTLRGTPIMYYGEEIGMANNDPKRKEDVRDPIGKLGWPLEKGRDGERTPMQWTNGVNAGFSTAKPWLAVPASAKTHNVESELQDPNSVLNFYKQLLHLRHFESALRDGEYISLNDRDPNVLAYVRRYKDQAIVVVLNMSPSDQNVALDLAPLGYKAPHFGVLLTNLATRPSPDARALAMGPYTVFIAAIAD